MPSISKCPKCKQEITVPDGLRREVAVRCPLCDAEYPLSDALAEAPPELIPVAPIESAPIESAPAKSLATETSTPPTAETPLIDTGETPADASALAAFNPQGSDQQEHEAISREAISSGIASAKPRPKRKQKSTGRQMAEALLGGFAGLLIGYYLLMWFGPARIGLPKINLPFLPHTMNQAPDDEAEQSGRDNKQTASPKQPPKKAAIKPEKKPDANVIVPLGDDKLIKLGDSEPDDYVGPRAAPHFVSLDLGTALRAADTALKSDEADGKVTDEVYGLLCKLGHIDVFASNEAADAQHTHRQQAVATMLRKLGRDAQHLTQIWDLAATRLKTEPQGGILLAGKVDWVGSQKVAEDAASKKVLYGAIIVPVVSSEKIFVMSDQPLPLKAQDQIIMFGSLIKKPAENVAGYSGSKPFIIWAGTSVEVK